MKYTPANERLYVVWCSKCKLLVEFKNDRCIHCGGDTSKFNPVTSYDSGDGVKCKSNRSD